MPRDPYRRIPYTVNDPNEETWDYEVTATELPGSRRSIRKKPKGSNPWDNAKAKAAIRARDAKVRALRDRKKREAEIAAARTAKASKAKRRGVVRDSSGRPVRDSSGRVVRTRYPDSKGSAAHQRNLARLRSLGLFEKGGSPTVRTNAKIGDHVRLPTKAELAMERRDTPGVDASTARAMSDRDLSRFMALEERVVRQRYEKSLRDREARKRRR